MSAARFNPDMLKLARDVREMTQSALATRTGFTQALISKIENGLIAQPSEDAVSKLVEALGFPNNFFYQQDKAEGFPHFHYRKRSKLGAKPLAHINATINIRRMHISKLIRSYEIDIAKPIPLIDLDHSGSTPEKVAEKLREYWMLPRGPIQNLTSVIEDAGGIVIPCKFGTALLDGISFRSSGLPPVMCMNREAPADRYRFSLAHELGHMVLHNLPDDDTKMESEAHRFAAAFLMPAADVRAHISTPKLSHFGRAKAHWKVSIKSLIKRSHDLKLITDMQYRNLLVAYSKSFKEGEPFEIEREIPTRMNEMISYHLNTLGYSVEDLGRLLALGDEEVRRAYIPAPRGLRLVVSN